MQHPLSATLESERTAVEADIRATFRGVTREGGVSWSEADVIDSYGSDREKLEARARDRDTAWEELVDDDHWKHDGAGCNFPFLDPIGVRYYLPAAMIRCLRDSDAQFVAFALTLETQVAELREYQLGKWTLLSVAHARVIIRFLRFMIAATWAPGDDMGKCFWRQAYDSYWRTLHSEGPSAGVAPLPPDADDLTPYLLSCSTTSNPSAPSPGS
jgi:hypothetical protein